MGCGDGISFDGISFGISGKMRMKAQEARTNIFIAERYQKLLLSDIAGLMAICADFVVPFTSFGSLCCSTCDSPYLVKLPHWVYPAIFFTCSASCVVTALLYYVAKAASNAEKKADLKWFLRLSYLFDFVVPFVLYYFLSNQTEVFPVDGGTCGAGVACIKLYEFWIKWDEAKEQCKEQPDQDEILTWLVMLLIPDVTGLVVFYNEIFQKYVNCLNSFSFMWFFLYGNLWASVLLTIMIFVFISRQVCLVQKDQNMQKCKNLLLKIMVLFDGFCPFLIFLLLWGWHLYPYKKDAPCKTDEKHWLVFVAKGGEMFLKSWELWKGDTAELGGGVHNKCENHAMPVAVDKQPLLT